MSVTERFHCISNIVRPGYCVVSVQFINAKVIHSILALLVCYNLGLINYLDTIVPVSNWYLVENLNFQYHVTHLPNPSLIIDVLLAQKYSYY